MEKLLNPYDKEFMRMAMLKHEETFRAQVNELHRLYRVQKLLMKKIEENSSFHCSSQISHRQKLQSRTWKKLDLEQPAEEYIAESESNGMGEIMQESEIELTLGPSNYNLRKKAETQVTSDSGDQSFSSSSTGSNHINRTPQTNDVGFVIGLDTSSSDYQIGSKFSVDVVQDQMRQQRLRQPPWLLQAVSLNMT